MKRKDSADLYGAARYYVVGGIEEIKRYINRKVEKLRTMFKSRRLRGWVGS
jgi:hypothetical protein